MPVDDKPPAAVIQTLPSPDFRSIGGAGFLFRMAAAYTGLHLLYGLLPDAWLAEHLYFHAFTRPAAHWLALLVPGEPVSALAHELRSPQLVLEVVRGCDGSGALFLLTAALAASGGSLRARLLGLGGGLLLVYALNLLRLVALYLLGTRAMPWFDPAHELVFPGLLVTVVVGYFLCWSSLALRDRR